MAKAFIFFSILFFAGIEKLAAQDKTFRQTVQFIKNKVACCSVPYSKSTTRRVETIEINKTGDVSIVYSDNKRKQTFNILELYKEKEGDTGIDIVMNGLFVQFYVNAEKIRHIRFATAADAKAVYNALLQLYKQLSGGNSKAIRSKAFCF